MFALRAWSKLIGIGMPVMGGAILVLLLSCSSDQSAEKKQIRTNTTLAAVELSPAQAVVALDGPVKISAAKNEWVSFTVQIQHLPDSPPGVLQVLQLAAIKSAKAAAISPANFTVYQVLSMPVDCRGADYVRQTGRVSGVNDLPRALLPVAIKNGAIDLATLRDPDHPADAHGRPTAQSAAPVVLWVDLHVPVELPPGDYAGSCDLVVAGQPVAQQKLPLAMHVYDFVIPDERHLLMVSQLQWDQLERLFANRFEAVTLRLVNRSDPRYAGAVKTIDDLVTLAERNRVEVVIPRLQPTVKWPAAQPPEFDWSDFDGLVGPWLGGEGFADKTPLGYWPLPAIDYLDNYDLASRQEYWSASATHFNQKDWLGRSAVFLPQSVPGRTPMAQAIDLSAQAADILPTHPLIRVTLPLEDSQLQFSSPANPNLLDPKSADRLLSSSTGMVYATPATAWPVGAPKPHHWLRTDLPGLAPYSGAGGDEADVRLWAWLAMVKQCDLILFSSPLPNQQKPEEPADPRALVWFYPGAWFGVEGSVPSIQLKWLRRAQQDYEYFYLAGQRRMGISAQQIARVMTKAVELQPGQNPDPLYALFCGDVDNHVWTQAKELLARAVLVHPAGQSDSDPAIKTAETNFNLDLIRWQEPHENHVILPRVTPWSWDTNAPPDENWANLKLGVDIYNGGDERHDAEIRWQSAGPGWEFLPAPISLGALPTYAVQRTVMAARINLDKLSADTRKPLHLLFVDDYNQKEYPAPAYIPVAASDRHEGGIKMDGTLSDWIPDDLLHDGKLLKFYNRPAIQHRQIELADTASQIYSGWADENFYLGFKLNGISSGESHHTNVPEYQVRRAWGEDLCEVLVQAVYGDNTTGPVLHLVCKPSGAIWVESKKESGSDSPWESLPGAGVRYATDAEKGVWTGELAIGWKSLAPAANGPAKPKLLRFNFSQHCTATGESTSWAGPLDSGRDDSCTGLIFLRDIATPGLHEKPAAR